MLHDCTQNNNTDDGTTSEYPQQTTKFSLVKMTAEEGLAVGLFHDSGSNTKIYTHLHIQNRGEIFFKEAWETRLLSFKREAGVLGQNQDNKIVTYFRGQDALK
jgi:hypothetical protein